MKSLKTKVIVILLSVFILYGAINYGIIHFIIFPSFLALENDEARKDVERSVQAIKREVYHLDSLAHDWSAWDETYEFAESPSEEYIEANLPISSFTDNSLNLIYICDTEGKVIWGEIYDEADILEHIFERGFSTKQEGSSGIGLHWCANTISSMNGKIYAESEGKGKGACLHLVFPKNS